MFIATFEKCFFTLFIPNMVLIRMIHVTIINNLLTTYLLTANSVSTMRNKVDFFTTHFPIFKVQKYFVVVGACRSWNMEQTLTIDTLLQNIRFTHERFDCANSGSLRN